MMEKRVIQYSCYGKSSEEAEQIADGLRVLEGCLDARTYGWSVCGHFEVPEGIEKDMVPEGCRIVPASLVHFLMGER